MSTRALIAVRTDAGYRSVHLAMDGDPQHAGHVLRSHYCSIDAALALMEDGDLMVLRSSPSAWGRASHATGRPQPAQDHVTFGDVEDALLANTEHLYVFDGDRWTHCEVDLLAI